MPAPRDPATPSIESGSQELVAVLVVDNDIVHARTMGECLSRLGYRVTVVGSGTEGAKKIAADSFDVVVTDLMMNDIGGIEILTRAKEASPETEVIEEPKPEAKPKGNAKPHADKIAEAFEAMAKEVEP